MKSNGVSSAVQSYFDKISRVSLLTEQEEIDLARKIQESLAIEKQNKSSSELTNEERIKIKIGQRAKKRMVEANLRLVVMCAKKFLANGNKSDKSVMHEIDNSELLDLIQDGNIGLLKAVEKFDPTRGYKLSTYAFWWIKQSMQRSRPKRLNTIRIPEDIIRDYKIIARAEEQISLSTKNASITNAAIAKYLGITEKRVVFVRNNYHKVISYNAKVNNDEERSELIDWISSEKSDDPPSFALEKDALLQKCITCLADKERDIIEMRYGLIDDRKCTLGEVAEKYNISRERVRQIEQRAINKMKLNLRLIANNKRKEINTCATQPYILENLMRMGLVPQTA